jgi:hypothetical protein
VGFLPPLRIEEAHPMRTYSPACLKLQSAITKLLVTIKPVATVGDARSADPDILHRKAALFERTPDGGFRPGFR